MLQLEDLNEKNQFEDMKDELLYFIVFVDINVITILSLYFILYYIDRYHQNGNL